MHLIVRYTYLRVQSDVDDFAFAFKLSLEEHSVYYLNDKQLLGACFCLTTGHNKYCHASA